MGMGFDVCLSGLNSCSKALEVVSNNISNVNTVGFKVAQTQFADVFAATLSGAASTQAVGLGSGVSRVVESFTQGDIRLTNNPLDMAINGKGFFRLNDNGAISYTRNGEFQLQGVPFPAGTTPTVDQLRNQQLRLVNGYGLNVSGYLASYSPDPQGIINTAVDPQDIVMDSHMPGTVTTSVTLGLNLDAGATVPSVAPFDSNDTRTFNYSTQVKAYYDGGTPHDLQFSFVRAAPQTANTWDMHVLDGGRAVGSVDLGAMTAPIEIPAGDVQFDIAIDNGSTVTATLPATSYASLAALQAGVQSAIDNALGTGKATVSLDADNHLVVSSGAFGANSAVAITGGSTYFGALTQTAGNDLVSTVAFDAYGMIDAASQVQTIAFGGGMPITLNLGTTSQYAGKFSVNALKQDGYASGQITSLSVGSQGVIQANYSNGLSRKAAQVVLANFANPDGLVNTGNNQWLASYASGAEILDTPANTDPTASRGMGTIQGGAVEEANIDLNQQLVDLIVQQRYYQANAQAVKTKDQMLQTLAGIR